MISPSSSSSSSSSPCQCPPGACGCQTASVVAERPRYYARQLVTPDAMTLEQDYFLDKLRRHNRMLHGWGVVCGAKVCPVIPQAGGPPSPWLVQVMPGYLLGPYGDEIVIERICQLDLSKRGGTGTGATTPGAMDDPWCSTVPAPTPTTGPIILYVAVKYVEVSTRPVRVAPSGCGCPEVPCEYSRLRDCFEINTLTSCPASHQTPPDLRMLFAEGHMPCPPCPPCPTDPWVVLAQVQLGLDGTIQAIDNCACRRIVISFAPYWLHCTSPQITEATLSPPDGLTSVLKVSGVGLDPKATVSLGPGVKVGPIDANASTSSLLVFPVAFDQGTRAVNFPLTLVNPDCTMLSAMATLSRPPLQ